MSLPPPLGRDKSGPYGREILRFAQDDIVAKDDIVAGDETAYSPAGVVCQSASLGPLLADKSAPTGWPR